MHHRGSSRQKDIFFSAGCRRGRREQIQLAESSLARLGFHVCFLEFPACKAGFGPTAVCKVNREAGRQCDVWKAIVCASSNKRGRQRRKTKLCRRLSLQGGLRLWSEVQSFAGKRFFHRATLLLGPLPFVLGCKKTLTLGRRSRKKGNKRPKSHNTQNASCQSSINCGESLTPPCSVQNKRDAEETSMVEMEPEGELRPESSPLSGSFVDEQPSSEQTHGASEESPSGSLGKVTSASQKRAIKAVNVDDWNTLDENDNPPSRKKQKENQCLKEGSKLCPIPQQKNMKRNKEKTSLDMQSSMSSLSSAPSSLDCSLTSDVAAARIPVEECQHSEAKSIDLMSSTDDSSDQIRNASFHADQGQEFVRKTEIQNQSEQNKKNDTESQPADTAVPGEKMEEDSSRKVDIVGEQIDPSKKQCATSSVGPGQFSQNTSNISDGSIMQPVSKGDTDSRSSDLNVNVTSAEEKGSGSSTEHQNCGMKTSLPESEWKSLGRKGEILLMLEIKDHRQETRRPVQKKKHEVPVVKQNRTPMENITVYFHAILSKDFKIDLDKHKVIILAGGISDYSDWTDTVCELTCTQDLGDHGYLIEGHTVISKGNLDKSISYKYVVKCEKQLSYEFIYKPSADGVHVNRSLLLSSKLIGDTDWHQYDDIICVKPENSWWKMFKKQISFWKDKQKDIVKGKLIAAKIMLDSLFSILKTWSRINIKSFFQQFHQFYLVNKRIMVHEGCRKEWKELQFKEQQLRDLIVNYLMEESNNILKQNTSMWDKIGLALITLTLISDYNIQLPKKELKQLCMFLCLEKSPADVNEIECFRETFSECPRMVEKLITFCDNCIEEEIHEWVWTLPILYLFTVNDSEYKTRTCLESEEKWARLECIRYSEFRDKNRILYKNLIMQKEHLLKGNRTLFRSWFCLLPQYHLVEFISGPYADPFDCLLGTFHRLKNLKIDQSNCQEGAVEQIKIYCSHYEEIQKFDSVILQIFEHCALEAIDSAYQKQQNLLELISKYDLNKLGKIVSATIIKSWPKDDKGTPLGDFQSILKHLFEWQDSRYIFIFNRAEENTLNQFTDEARVLMMLAESLFQTAANQLVTGHILIKHLELIIKYKREFIKCMEQLHSNELLEGLKLEKVVDLRREEVLHVKREQTYLGVLLDMLRKVQCYVKVDLIEVEQKHSGNLAEKILYDVVKVREPTSCSDDGIETCLHLSEDLKKVSKVVYDYKDSHIFLHCWEQAAKMLMGQMENSDTEEPLDMEDVNYCLFDPCYKEFQRIYDSLKLGDLTFAEVNVLFKDFNNYYEELKKDFKIMCKLQAHDNGKWISERIQQIQQYYELDLALDSAKVIDKVKDVLKLSGDFSVLQQLLNLTSEFQAFQEEKLSSMSSSLIRAKKLLQDITKERLMCLEELAIRKEFVHWVKEALEDKNELKVFVELASISAGENDMDVDRVACFHDAVFGYSSLLYDLKREAGFKEFMKCLENIWKALESDHNLPMKLSDSARYMDWLKTIKESHGSVELSSISLATSINEKGIYRIKAPEEGQKVCLDSVLDLTIQESHGDQEKIRQYSLEELQELMNKLMLMSGKEEQSAQVEKFSVVFSSVQRFALSFMNLYSAGNMLFRNWIADIYCSPKRLFCIEMNFNLNSICGLCGSGDVAEVLPAMCKKMESFLERWNQFMSAKRSQYFYLNYYMADQLVYLCQELGSGKPSESALMMLSFIKHSCSRQDIEEVSKLLISEIPNSFDVMYELQARRRELTEHLEEIWGSYMENMGLFLPDCFDVETLGRFLSNLADLEKRSVVRVLPQGLLTRQPNLILCPRSEILVSTISIYMNSPEQMLPSYDEVLLCTPQTSYEQVELFMRRCLTPNNKEKKIYTLLFADELSYDVSYKLEELYQNLNLKHSSDFHLVMFCNCEREHFYIPSVFNNFIIHMTPLRPPKDIQSYLGKHYKATELGNPSTSIFKNNMCVGIVSSKRAGMGKSLYIKRMYQKMKAQLQGHRVHLRTIRLIDPHVNEGKILNSLFLLLDQKYQKQPMIVHFDITSSVQTGISEFLFKLFILRYLEDADGKIWLRKQCHLYVAEILQPPHSPKKQRGSKFPGLNYSFLDVFPQIICRSPKEVLDNGIQRNLFHDSSDPQVDQEMFCSEAFQRPFQYLIRENRGENLDAFQYRKDSVEGTPGECLQLFLMYCGVIDPSWSELRNFAWFLNLQLRNCETSVFCNASFVQDTLQGFKNFVVKFMILMAKDFATPSLNISDESPGMQVFEEVTEEALAPFLLRKKWESEPHPYIFFNEDCVSMTFIGFHLQYNNNGSIDAINPLNGNIIKRNVMTVQLFRGLVLQRVPFNINFDALTRAEKIEKLCMVLGIQWPTDPDETYELTTDNILKMLAIEMRFRCGIPVVLMGETGCGKTRLIKYLCELRKSGANSDNLKLVKVHGGTTADTIYAKVREAEGMAQYNKSNYQFDTILFFDEANTTDAVSSIKEVLCDHTIEGKPLRPNSGLQIIAACNPYRKHTPKMIQRLESAGLGYRVKAEDTSEKLGSIPLRQLVYRVHALPPSMIPLVWDFGQLNNITEKLYIEQIVQKLAKSIPMSATEIQMITEVLFKSQSYMRQRKDECSFISLRDVERCVEVFKWFHGYSECLIEHLEKSLESNPKSVIQRDRIIWSLILSVGVCYHASLEQKEAYWRVICKIFPEPYDNEKVVLEEISLIQDLFLSGVPVRQRIAKNMALKENVFMMVICIELKIPLFLIGKPGSSKSLAKTIVADAMQGQAAYSDLYKELKQIHLVSFQCSPHSTPEGIINTFKHCARFQEGKNLREYVSVVVLDEIGLAEDSPKMPLKTLHPLLEDGCIDDNPLPHKKVGFVGISNWALDPAKMNRGIFVSRGDLNKNELIKSAKGICSSDLFVLQKVERFFPIFANAYEEICQNQTKDFFGLRDYYSLVKMLFALTKNSKSIPGPREIAEVVLRNFSGKEGVEVLDTFMSKIPEGGDENYKDISTIDLVKQNIYSDYQDGECRYLLVLTENYAALQILQQRFFRDVQPEIIFGSSFPKDQEYTQICRNINRVKICMETGKMVVLLNLQNLYESLYDALNQYYVQLAGQKYVDLGLGTHRVKCRVHPKFRLIVIEEKKVVYKQFPIPLINRLEKHNLDINTVLNKWQKTIVENLKKWVDDFVAVKTEKYFMGQQTYRPSDVFIGYRSDSCASVVLQVTENLKESLLSAELRQKVQEESELVLLNCATPDSVVRLGDSKLDFLRDKLAKIYFQQQQHTSFAEFLHRCLQSDSRGHTVFIEMTTFSRLLTAADTEILEAELQHNSDSLKVLFLQQFDTEYSFLKDIRNFFAVRTDGSKILIIQTDFENESLSAQLIASARYSAVNEVNKIQENQARVFIIFITKLSRIEGGSCYIGFHGGLWQSVHIDDLRTSKDMISDITSLRNITISQLFSENTGESAENPETARTEEEEIEEEMEVEASPISEPEIFSKVLDTTILLRSCVQSAVGMLRDHNEDAGRSAKRIEILLSLLSEEDTLQGNFLKITKSRLTCLLKKQEENTFSMKEWVLREASNLTALQEGGTFRDYNLDLLVKPRTEGCVKTLWLFIFNELKLLDIPYVMGQSSSQTKPIQVQNDMEVSTGAGNKMPFSWKIKDYLEVLRVQAQHVTKNEAHAEKFLDIFRMTPLGQHIACYSEEEKSVFFHYYVRDFILLAMGVTSERELNMLQVALLSCVEEMKATSSSAETRVPSLPCIHLAYHQFRSRLQNFSRILAVYPEVLHTLEQRESRGGCMLQSQMVLDVFAALACTEMLSSGILKQKTRTWLQQVKDLQMPIELVCTANSNQVSGSQCSQMLQEVKLLAFFPAN
ncbi:hypothetical protein E2320_015980, partial [Naja naja]